MEGGMAVRVFPRLAQPGSKSIVSRLLLGVWGAGSLLWVAVWLRFFYLYCDFNGNFACVVGGFLETIFYSLPQALIRLLGPPALVLLLGLAARWAIGAWMSHWSQAREHDALGME
jgi:hypothetical protein